jgi:hypothetical protein
MKIPTTRTRRDMEIVAELRAAGATWETAALKVQRRAGAARTREARRLASRLGRLPN